MRKSLGGIDRRQLAVKIDTLLYQLESSVPCFSLAFSHYGIGFCAFILNMWHEVKFSNALKKKKKWYGVKMNLSLINI